MASVPDKTSTEPGLFNCRSWQPQGLLASRRNSLVPMPPAYRNTPLFANCIVPAEALFGTTTSPSLRSS